MFERYTESARRSLFFARAAAIDVGSAVIEPDHLLTAVLRELRTPRPNNDLPSEVAASVSVGVETAEKWESADSRKGDVPLSAATQRILAYAMHEADDLHHRHIGPEHLLLGILRSDDAIAARLKREGITLEGVRARAAESSGQS